MEEINGRCSSSAIVANVDVSPASSTTPFYFYFR